MKALLMHQTVTNHDAIGNDITAMSAILSEQCECAVYAENKLNKSIPYLDDADVVNWLADPETIAIYHHSVFWQHGEELLSHAQARMVFRYHNITPPAFFAPYNEFHTAQCAHGREQTELLGQIYPDAYWLCDSYYNAMDIQKVPKERIRICAPFHMIETWAKGLPDEGLLKNFLRSRDIHLLTVGRIAPNKGHLFLLEVLRIFRSSYPEGIHLWILGKEDEGLPGYNNEIRECIARYGLQDNVHCVGEITDAIMSAYYLGCDFYLCASEHEGFCVPLEEAQYFQLPIIARRSSAIPETLGSEQLVLGEDPRDYAAAIHLLYQNESYRRWLREKGQDNYQKRFTFDRIRASFLDALSGWNLLPEKEIS